MSQVEIDESLYSRQQIMLGKEAMQKMAASSVFLDGLGGVGVEVAKNVALAGVKILTLNDTKNVEWKDLATQFYCNSQDIGKNRAEVSLKQIQELNPYTKLTTSSEDLATADLSFLEKYKCVVLSESPLSTQIRVNEYCHSHNIAFIAADVYGVFSSVFCDFGEKFEILDKNGEEPREVMIESITKAKEGVVKCLENHMHGFETGDVVTFREVQGMTELNETQHKIKVLSPYEFSIGDTSNFHDFKKGTGIVKQVKVPIHMSFATLKESLSDPKLSICDFGKMDSLHNNHIGLQALHSFVESHKYLPKPWNKQDAEEFIKIAQKINDSSKNKVQLNETILTQFAFTSQGCFVGLTSFVGGVASQEVLKSISGKYTPLNNWLYLDAVEVMPPIDSDPAQFQPEGSRYDSQIICLGKAICQKLKDAKLFMIGCGAIGCEMMKNYAMLGISSGNGNITVTDNDLIEKSNLNRQFLFRSKDIQRPKSETAATSVKAMNPDLKITANLDKVGTETEDKYSDKFFEGLDLVVNALDNVNARLYVDSRCVTNKKPLLESGTLGPKGHVQVIVPFLTESYGSQRDPPEKDVPFCTLKSFPSSIEHCIEWARDFSFGGLFVSKPNQWNQLICENDLIERLSSPGGGGLDFKIVRTVHKLLKLKPNNFEDCIRFARLKFQSYYVNKALQLLHSFPPDHTIDDKGTLFWSSPKRPPTPLEFDFNDEMHRQFVLSLASLWAEVWGIEKEKNLEKMKKIIETTEVPKFVPKSGKKIETDESIKKEEAEQDTSEEDDLEEILKSVAQYFKSTPLQNIAKMNPIDFEKDDDTNFHIDFIMATSNLRARVYKIPEVERLKVKAIAGRIMPAIATTTSAVSGLVCVELVKIIKGCKLEEYKNLFMNLAIPFWGLAEPGAAEKKKIVGDTYYTIWDRWDIKLPDPTLNEVLQWFEKEKKLTVSGVFKGAIMIYVPMFPGHSKRKTKKMKDLLKRKKEPYIDLIVTFNVNEEDVSGPPVRFHFE